MTTRHGSESADTRREKLHKDLSALALILLLWGALFALVLLHFG